MQVPALACIVRASPIAELPALAIVSILSVTTNDKVYYENWSPAHIDKQCWCF
jgi:hypothetical protein